MAKKVYCVSGSTPYYLMFLDEGMEIVSDLQKADLVCFTGGEDVSPSLYNEHFHQRTYSNPTRDQMEQEIFNEVKSLGIPMVGICRGGQFLNVMNGGLMYQHVTNHTCNHLMKDAETFHTILVTSTHHQMMKPSKDATVIAIAHQKGIKEYMEGPTTVRESGDSPDVEVCFYSQTRCLCFQPHPEFRSYGCEAMRPYFFSLIQKHLFN